MRGKNGVKVVFSPGLVNQDLAGVGFRWEGKALIENKWGVFFPTLRAVRMLNKLPEEVIEAGT